MFHLEPSTRSIEEIKSRKFFPEPEKTEEKDELPGWLDNKNQSSIPRAQSTPSSVGQTGIYYRIK